LEAPQKSSLAPIIWEHLNIGALAPPIETNVNRKKNLQHLPFWIIIKLKEKGKNFTKVVFYKF